MKTLLTSILLTASLAATSVIASPRFEGQNMRALSSEDRIQFISDRMTEQGMTADEIQAQIDTIQNRLDAQSDRMQNQDAMQERMVNMEQIRERKQLGMVDGENFSTLTEEERIIKITENMTAQGYSQDEIDAKIIEVTERLSEQ